MPKKSVRSVLTSAYTNKQEVEVSLSANAPGTSWSEYTILIMCSMMLS